MGSLLENSLDEVFRSPPKKEAKIQLGSTDAWSLTALYHDLKKSSAPAPLLRELRQRSIIEIVRRARSLVRSPAHPQQPKTDIWSAFEGKENSLDVDFEWDGEVNPDPRQWEVTVRLPKYFPFIVCVDTSLSMNGEKLANTAIALAVLRLSFPHHQLGIVTFESEASVLVRPGVPISTEEMVGRFLDIPAEGYTHLEKGLRKSLELKAAYRRDLRGRVTLILITDGKYTAGRDPTFLMKGFEHTIVMKMGAERSSLDFCRRLARSGGGWMQSVAGFEELPWAMHELLKGTVRGNRWRRI